jgi:outer membrane protein
MHINQQKGDDFMNKKALLITGLICLLLAGVAPAAEKISAEKIGFVDIRDIMMNSESGKKAAAEFKNIYEKNRLIVQGRESELQKLKEEIEKQRSILTEAALKEKETAYQAKFREYQVLVKEANDDLQGKDQELSKNMIPEISKVVNAIGEKDKYTVIFDLSAMPIPYYNKTADLTKRVMDDFNKSYKPNPAKK